MFRNSLHIIVLACLCFGLSGCTFRYLNEDLVGEWEVTCTAVTIKGMLPKEVREIRAKITGKVVVFYPDHSFTETRQHQYDNEGIWDFNENQQRMTLSYKFGGVRRLNFGVKVEGKNEMKWSFTDSDRGGVIWTLERRTK